MDTAPPQSPPAARQPERPLPRAAAYGWHRRHGVQSGLGRPRRERPFHRRRPQTPPAARPLIASSAIPSVRSLRPSISSSTMTTHPAPSGCTSHRSIARRCWHGRWFPAAHRQRRHPARLNDRQSAPWRTLRHEPTSCASFRRCLFETFLVVVARRGNRGFCVCPNRGARGSAGQFAFRRPDSGRDGPDRRGETRVLSGADGTFTFDNLPPGTYHLSVRSAGILRGAPK